MQFVHTDVSFSLCVACVRACVRACVCERVRERAYVRGRECDKV